MSAPATIQVTQEHINAGEPQNGEACPIALALKAQWQEPVTDIEVLAEGATIYTESGYYTADTWPDEASSFVEAFDCLDDVEPVQFTVTWDFHPDEWDA